MIEIIEIIVAVIIVGLFIRYRTYIVGIFSFIPTYLMAFVLLLIALNVILFIIHRK